MLSGRESNNKIKGAIMEVIAFFDLFDYPLTASEIWAYLSVKCEPAEAAGELDKIKFLAQNNGLYFLIGREEIVNERQKRSHFTKRKFKRALRVARLFKLIPWIRLIAVGNMMGEYNLKDESDIDLFIISKKKRLWITRFFCVGLTKLLGLRPTEANKRDKICLSFYVAEDALDLRGLMLDNNIEKNSGEIKFPGLNIPQSAIRNPQLKNDPYFVYWLAGLAPIYDKDKAYEQLIEANAWIGECLPNWQPIKMTKERSAGQGFDNLYNDIIDLLIGGLEPTVKKFQLWIMPKRLKSVMNQGTDVVISDSVLKLYATDRRIEYREKFLKKLKELNVNFIE